MHCLHALHVLNLHLPSHGFGLVAHQPAQLPGRGGSLEHSLQALHSSALHLSSHGLPSCGHQS